MILVIGGLASGKRDYVKTEYGYTDAELAGAILDERPVLYDLQELVRKAPEQAEELLPVLLEKAVVICNESGCGVVPVDKSEREVREVIGRLCITLAGEAEKVVRVVCGIPTVIKE